MLLSLKGKTSKGRKGRRNSARRNLDAEFRRAVNGFHMFYTFGVLFLMFHLHVPF